MQDVKWSHTERWACHSCFGEWVIEADGWGNYDLTFKPFTTAPEHPSRWESNDLPAKRFPSAEAAKAAVMQEDFHMESDYGDYVDRHMKSLGRLGKTTDDHQPSKREEFETDVHWMK